MLAAIGLLCAEAHERRGGPAQEVAADVRHAGALLRGFLDQRIDGVVGDRDPTGRLPAIGLHEADDGWVQTYGLRALRERTEAVLATGPRTAEALADALNAAGVPGAVVRTAAAWEAHPQGRALRTLPVVSIQRIGDSPAEPPAPAPDGAPLEGLRALDLTRILAGPVCGRTLAEHGADVLQIGSPRLEDVRRAHVDTAVGKRSCHLELGDPADRGRLDALVGRADVVCSNARPGAMARHGLDAAALAARRPGIVAVEIDCYGHVGPWRQRTGFEPLAQVSAGWADEHRDARGRPTIVPALPCDHATGYLAALGALEALRRRATEGGSWHVRTSLARTAMWLRDQPGRFDPAAAGLDALHPEATLDLREALDGPHGRVDQLRPGARLSRTPARWRGPAPVAGSAPPAF